MANLTNIEINAGITQEELIKKIEAQKIKIDEDLVKLHETRLNIEAMRKKADERYKAFLKRMEG